MIDKEVIVQADGDVVLWLSPTVLDLPKIPSAEGKGVAYEGESLFCGE
jgi:hypothetical protein